jgi:hypothetical protein
VSRGLWGCSGTPILHSLQPDSLTDRVGTSRSGSSPTLLGTCTSLCTSAEGTRGVMAVSAALGRAGSGSRRGVRTDRRSHVPLGRTPSQVRRVCIAGGIWTRG